MVEQKSVGIWDSERRREKTMKSMTGGITDNPTIEW